MNIVVYLNSISRLSGGVMDATRNLYLNSNLANNISTNIFSYIDKYTEEDKHLWNSLPLHLYQSQNSFHYNKNLKRDLLNFQSELLHVHGLWQYPHLFMKEWKTHSSKPLVCSPHGMLDPFIINSQSKMKRLIANLLFNQPLKMVDCFHALCLKELEDIRLYGLKQPVAIIPNAVNIPENNIKKASNDGKKHLLYLGRLHPKKGIDLLIYAVSKIKKEKPNILKNWIIDIVGWDHENSLQNLKLLVKQENLDSEIIFHGGLFNHQKDEMYLKADVYILPSHGEGLPMTVLEAWSWRTPVIMTPQCNLNEGFKYNAAIKVDDNVESIKRGIETTLTMNKEELNKIGNNGLELVKEHFSWDASAKKMLLLYNWLITKENKPNFIYTDF